MKKAILLMAIMPFIFASCGSDNDEPTSPDNGQTTEKVNPANVFTNGLPKTVNGMTVTTNSKGQVAIIKDAETTVTFEYLASTPQSAPARKVRATSTTADVIMKITEGNWQVTYYLTLDNNGFVTHAVEESNEGKGDIMDFSYDSNGHMVKMVQDYDYDDVTTIEWQNGDIVKVVFTDGESKTENWVNTISYTSSSVKSPMDNKGCVMLYDEIFGVDIDYLTFAYFAGLLGKATKHLPVSATEVGGYGDAYTYTFDWRLDNAGFPTSVNNYDVQITFTW